MSLRNLSQILSMRAEGISSHLTSPQSARDVSAACACPKTNSASQQASTGHRSHWECGALLGPCTRNLAVSTRLGMLNGMQGSYRTNTAAAGSSGKRARQFLCHPPVYCWVVRTDLVRVVVQKGWWNLPQKWELQGFIMWATELCLDYFRIEEGHIGNCVEKKYKEVRSFLILGRKYNKNQKNENRYNKLHLLFSIMNHC